MCQDASGLPEEIKAVHENDERHFAGTNQHVVALRQDLRELRQGLIKLRRGQNEILKRLIGFHKWLTFITNELDNRPAKSLKEVAAALRYGLKNPHIAPETIRLRQTLEDPGQIFFPGFATEIDLIAENSKLTVFEVKATSKTSDVDLFAMKLKLLALQNPTQQVHGIFICLAPSEDIQQRCVQLGIELVS